MDYNNDSGNPCDPNSSEYDPSQCEGEDSEDVCDFNSTAYDPSLCPEEEPEEPEPDPCDEKAQAEKAAANKLFGDTDVKNSLAAIPPSAQNESAFNINNTNGDITATEPVELPSSTGGTGPSITNNTVASVHTHLSSNAPSAQDLFSLGYVRDVISGYTASYVSTNNGNLYALYIDDANKLNNFIDANPGFVAADRGFDRDRKIGKLFWDTNTDLQKLDIQPRKLTLELQHLYCNRQECLF